MRAPLILLVLAGLVAGTLFFIGGSSSQSAPNPGHSPLPYASPSQSGDSNPAQDLEQTSRVEVEVDQPIPPPQPEAVTQEAALEPGPAASGWDSFDPDKAKELYPLPWDDWVGELPGLPGHVYEDKYAGFDGDALTLAFGEVQANFLINVTKAFSDLEAQDLATRHFLQFEENEQGNKVPIGLDLQIDGACPLHKITASRGDNGEYIRDFYWLDPDDPAYEALYLIQDEMWWLQGKVSQAHTAPPK